MYQLPWEQDREIGPEIGREVGREIGLEIGGHSTFAMPTIDKCLQFVAHGICHWGRFVRGEHFLPDLIGALRCLRAATLFP
jgi:hypothetical protein